MSTIKQQWQAQKARVGPAITVLRALPSTPIEAIGPFVFLDHVGPMPTPNHGLAAHPHAGIEVITYLIEGANEHRDSAGHSGFVTSGGAQWITAGRGMLHAEQIGLAAYPTFQAIQLWTRLPVADEDVAPRYAAVTTEQVLEYRVDGVKIRLLAGSIAPLLAQQGPIELMQPSLLAHIILEPNAQITVPVDSNFELGAYSINGQMSVGGVEVLSNHQMVMFETTHELTFKNNSDASSEILLLGGERAQRPLVFHGSFVFSSKAKALQAEQAFFAGEMGQLDGVPF